MADVNIKVTVEDATKAGRRHSEADVRLGRSLKQKAREIDAGMNELGFSDEPAQVEFDPVGAPEKAVITFGTEVKAMGDGRVGGYLVRFSDANTPDLTGDYFTPATDFGDHESTPILYHHGLDPVIKARALARGTLKKDEVGVWVEAQLKLRDEYEKEIYGLAEKGKLGWSSGTAGHLVARTPEGKAHRITAWPLGVDASLTPTPAEPRNAAITLKAYIAELDKAERPAPKGAPADAVKTETEKPITKPMEVTKMTDEITKTSDIKTAEPTVQEKQMSAEFAALMAKVEAIAGDVKAMKTAPVEKTPGVVDKDINLKFTPKLGLAEEQLAEMKTFLNTKLTEHSKNAWDEHTAAIAKDDLHKRHLKLYGDLIRGNLNQREYDQAIKATIQEGVASLGGNLVPALYSNQMVGTLKEDSILRRAGAFQFPVAGTNSLNVATITRSTSAPIATELAAATQTEPTFGNQAFVPYAYRAIYIASRESILDSRFPLESVLQENSAWQFVQSENNHLGIGTGSSQPHGFAASGNAQSAVSAGSVISLLDADDLIDLYHAIPYQYRDNAVWLIHDQTIKSVRKLRENGAASGNFMWQPGLQAGQPDRILGRPVYPLNTMASTGSGNPIIAFGDPRFFWVADFNNGGFDFQVLNELYALSAAVGYWFWKRFDSHLMVSEAVRGLYLR